MPSARVLAALLCEQFDQDELELLREDPLEAIELVVPEVTANLVEHDPAQPGCSLEGHYHEATRNITVQRAVSRRRTRFTALHEFGHDQARRHPDVARTIAQLSAAAGRRFEEEIVNAFAASILIPDEVVDAVLEDKPSTADAVIQLFHDPRVAGSREACCVRVAQRMLGEGYVVLAEDGIIRFCATVGSAYRVARGVEQDEAHLIRRASKVGRATDNNVTLRHATGTLTPLYAGQAVADEGYVFAVLTDATNLPWGGWLPPRSRAWGEPPEIWCQECDEVTEAWQRCETDPSHRVCSSCGWCECRTPTAKTPEKTCKSCFLPKHVDLFNEDSEICSDCL